MNNKRVTALIAIFKIKIIASVALILFIGMFIGCTKGQKGNTCTTTRPATTKTESSTATEGTQGKFAEEQKVKSVLKIMLESFENKDAAKFKQIISPKGVVIIRNYVSVSQVYEGNKNTQTIGGTRGINYRGVFSQVSFPDNFTIELNGEVLFKPERYFLNIERYDVSDIPVVKLDKYKFGFKDDMYNHILEPDTIKVWNTCSEIRDNIGGENNWKPYIILISEGEAAFSISETGSNTGNWAIFEKTEDKYYLRALLDFR